MKEKKHFLYRTARIKNSPEGTGYVKINSVNSVDGVAVFWVQGLDGVMRGHYAIFSEYELDEFCL